VVTILRTNLPKVWPVVHFWILFFPGKKHKLHWVLRDFFFAPGSADWFSIDLLFWAGTLNSCWLVWARGIEHFVEGRFSPLFIRLG